MPTKPVTAHFASLRSDLLVVERSANPTYVGGREVGIEPGRYHQFTEHRCTVSGRDSVEYMRARARAADAPGIWEMDASDVQPVTDLLAELATADIDRVREILRDEEEGSQRQVIIDVCRRVLVRSNVSERRPGEKATVSG
jgi:hypothetical protein